MTLAEIVRCHCHDRDAQDLLRHAEADPLSKKDLSFQFVGRLIEYIGSRMTDLIILIWLSEREHGQAE